MSADHPVSTDGGRGGIRPGEIRHGDDPVEINPGRPVLTLRVRNVGDRPVQVGSHYHFAAANPALQFDREAARGHRLAVPAGTAVRFEPGVEREVDLVPLAGGRIVPGLRTGSAGPSATGGLRPPGTRSDDRRASFDPGDGAHG